MRGSLMALALALAPLAQPAPLLARETAVVQRPAGAVVRDGSRVTLSWQALSGPVTIWRLQRADARAQDGVLVAQGATGGTVVLDVPVAPRPYFLLRDRAGRELRLAERVLPLEGGTNFRDLGGYRTADGQVVRWGRLYRSAAMHMLTAGDYRYLGQLGIGTVCDFRASEERASAAVDWPADVKPKLLTRDYALDFGGIVKVLGQPGANGEMAAAAMAEGYRELPFEHKGQFAEMFRELLTGRPLAFNCSAGKDRTGMAAYLLLTALGVPHETALADYLLSNQYYRPKPAAPGAKADASMAMLAKLPPEVLNALMGVDARYMQAALDSIEARGGMARYLREDLGLGAAELSRLRALYLTR